MSEDAPYSSRSTEGPSPVLTALCSPQCAGEENCVDSRTIYVGHREPPPGAEAYIPQRHPDNRIVSSKVSCVPVAGTRPAPARHLAPWWVSTWGWYACPTPVPTAGDRPHSRHLPLITPGHTRPASAMCVLAGHVPVCPGAHIHVGDARDPGCVSPCAHPRGGRSTFFFLNYQSI